MAGSFFADRRSVKIANCFHRSGFAPETAKAGGIDRDNVVKTYKNADALSEIQHEREVARLALILGVPTAISYDVVRVGNSYGSVFELLNAKSFSKLLANEPDQYEFCVREYVKMLKKIHAIEVPEGKLPAAKVFCSIFVQMGLFVHFQRWLSFSFEGSAFWWRSMLLQVAIFAPSIFMMPAASYFAGHYRKGRVMAW